MTVLERPVIAIAGLCSGLNKTDVQIELLNQLKKDELNVKAISNNPIGCCMIWKCLTIRQS